MSATVEVAQAWVNRWQAAPALATALPGGIQSDDLDTDQARPGGVPRALPYAQLRVELDRPLLLAGFRWWHDFRRVTVECYGTHKQALLDALSQVHAVFDEPNKLDFSFTAPGTVGHLLTRAGLASGFTPPPGAVRRAYVWQVFASWLVVTTRTVN